MEIEKVAPITVSPLDSCRGRGRYPILPRLKSTRPKQTHTETTETPTVVILVIQESPIKVGATHYGK